MAKVNVFTYRNYRAFLVDWLKENGFTYRQFAARYASIISFIALAKLLSKGRMGTREKSDYRMSPEALARLGKAIRLSDLELKHLILLRLENDADVMDGQFGNAYQHIMKELVEDHRVKFMEKPKDSAKSKRAGVSQSAALLIEIFDLLSPKMRARIMEEAVLQAKIYAARQTGRPGVKALNSLVKELSRLKDMDAP